MDLENTSEGSTFPEHKEERRAGNWHFTGDNDDARILQLGSFRWVWVILVFD